MNFPDHNSTAAPGQETAKQSEALDSNASGSQSLVPATLVSGEYTDPIEPGKPIEREVKPISRAALSKPGTTMEHLHKMSEHELDVLDALNNEGRQIIKTRLIAIWDEMYVRFERGESVNGISGTGGKGMGKYLRSIGVDPAKRRSWKFEIRQEEALRLAQENPPPKRTTKKKEIVINSETEADLIAKAGVKMAQKLIGDGMTPERERLTIATEAAKEILDAISDGRYQRLEPLPLSGNAPVPQSATYGDWENHHTPAPDFKLKYFAEASGNFTDRFRHSVRGSAFTKVLTMLTDDHQQVLAHAHDFAQLVVVLRGAADNLNLLGAAITSALTHPLKPEPASQEDATRSNLSPAEHTDAPEATGEPPKHGEDSHEGQSTESTQPKEEQALFCKKRVLRMDGEEIIDYPVFKRGGDGLPEDVFDTEADAQTYIANSIDKKGAA
jgi:hypothetical protein